jgi:hypothetical protein
MSPVKQRRALDLVELGVGCLRAATCVALRRSAQLRSKAPRSERSSVHSLTRVKVRPRVKPRGIAYPKVKPRETPWLKGSLSLGS